MTDGNMTKWVNSPETLEDGFYWWRYGEKCSQDNYEILQVCNGIIVDTRPIDSYGINWEVYEHKDFSGEWSGPIIPPK